MSMTYASRRYFNNLRRDALVIANRPRLPSAGLKRLIVPALLSRSDTDRRYFHPAGAMRPLKSLFGSPVRATPYVKPKAYVSSSNYSRSIRAAHSTMVGGYKLPAIAAVCVRRNIRREVLFAAGRGGGGKRPPKFNYTSAYRC